MTIGLPETEKSIGKGVLHHDCLYSFPKYIFWTAQSLMFGAVLIEEYEFWFN
jgi:hypothetical protein